MSDQSAPDVGNRIHQLRRARGLSLRDLSKRSRLSPNAISRIERGTSSPTVTTLHQLATALDVDIVTLFEAAPEASTVLVRAYERPRTLGEGVLIESLGAGLPSQRLGPFSVTLMPGASGGGEPISHAGEEFVYCLEGEVDYLVQGGWHRPRPGDSLLFLASQPHGCRNTGLVAAKLLLVIQARCEEISSAQQRHLMVSGAPAIEPEGGEGSRRTSST